MTIPIHNKNEFVDKFLTPLSRINNSCSLHLKGDKLTALVATPDASVILNAVWKFSDDLSEENKLNIPDINKLIKVLDCIREEYVTLKVNSNNISYNEKGIKFKYHLLEDGILSKVKVVKLSTDKTLVDGSKVPEPEETVTSIPDNIPLVEDTVI